MNIVVAKVYTSSLELGWQNVLIVRSPKDRSSILGNPFDMRDEEFREFVCETYRKYLWKLWRTPKEDFPFSIAESLASKYNLPLAQAWIKKCQNVTIESIQEAIDDLAHREKAGDRLRLLCWCYPKQCHGDILVKCIEWRQNSLYF